MKYLYSFLLHSGSTYALRPTTTGASTRRSIPRSWSAASSTGLGNSARGRSSSPPFSTQYKVHDLINSVVWTILQMEDSKILKLLSLRVRGYGGEKPAAEKDTDDMVRRIVFDSDPAPVWVYVSFRRRQTERGAHVQVLEKYVK